MPPHTREKLLLYKQYLESYLTVMCMQQYWNHIYIWEPFAGQGDWGNNNKGSALIAAEVIDKFRKDYPEKNILLYLNELDAKKYQILQRSVKKFDEFVSVFNDDADEFLNEVSKVLSKNRNNQMHNLFFIDPYGYTQYKTSLESLLRLDQVDYLIFIPTNHIYRFSRKENNPARKFLLELGIDGHVLNDIRNIDSFAKQLTEILKKMATTDFGYSYKLQSKGAKGSNRIFHLFFITKHIRGAEKFLEAKNKTKSEVEGQLAFLTDDTIPKKNLVKILQSSKVSNHKLYEELIKEGYLPSEATPILKKMEKSGELEVEYHPKRRTGVFYLKDKDKVIYMRYVSWANQE